jgi:predicted O-methyltransferase YrrM
VLTRPRHEIGIEPGSFIGLHPDEVALFRQRLADLSGIGVEIGCMDGFSSCIILAVSKLCLTSIDPLIPDSMDPTLMGQEQNIMANVAPWRERFQFIKDYSYKVSRRWTTPIDFLFIDGDHRYDAALRDFHEWTPFLRQAGLLAMHDARMNRPGGAGFHPGPSRVADEALFTRPAEWRVIGEAHSLVMAVRV